MRMRKKKQRGNNKKIQLLYNTHVYSCKRRHSGLSFYFLFHTHTHTRTHTVSGYPSITARRKETVRPLWSIFIAAASALSPVCLCNVWVGGKCSAQHYHSDINTWWGLSEVQYFSANIIPSFSPSFPLSFHITAGIVIVLRLLLFCLSICFLSDKCSHLDCYFHGPLAW